MKVLVIGDNGEYGGREHAIADAIKRGGGHVYAIMRKKHPGIARLCSEYLLTENAGDASAVAYANKIKADAAIVGPEAPLQRYIVDDLSVPCASPCGDAARIEWDKAWMRKEIMQKYGIDGLPEYQIFEKGQDPSDYILDIGDVAVKPTGLTGGKGVRTMGKGGQLKSARDAIVYANDVLKVGDVLIEEYLNGEEFTVQAISDGRTLVFMPAVQDHKRAFRKDRGPNTGGMGSYNDVHPWLPFMDKEDYVAAQEIMYDTTDAIKKETGELYKGILYGQFMKTKDGIKVVEFNSRFGDPEAMNVLPLLETNFLDIINAINSGTLGRIDVKSKKKATVCLYGVPTGYPKRPAENVPIRVNKEIRDALLFWGGVYERDNKIYTTRSRGPAVVGVGDSISEAYGKALRAKENIKGKLRWCDEVGSEELINRRINHINKLCGAYAV